MQESSDYWFSNQMRLRYAEDFQAIENFKITEARGRFSDPGQWCFSLLSQHLVFSASAYSSSIE